MSTRNIHCLKDSHILHKKCEVGNPLHCFSGCETKDVMTAVGLDISDLFYQKRTSSRLTGASPRCYTEVLQRERILVAVINSAEKNERPLTTKEQNRRRLGQLRINKIGGVLHE